jgi:hypothetical protein
MLRFIADSWTAIMDHRRNPLRSLDLATQHYFMQVLGWMWSMIFSLTFLSIFQFGLTWLAHLLIIGGIAMTVALFREAERRQQRVEVPAHQQPLSGASKCVWRLDSEA